MMYRTEVYMYLTPQKDSWHFLLPKINWVFVNSSRQWNTGERKKVPSGG